MRPTLAVFLLLTAALAAGDVAAKEYNQRTTLDPGKMAKIQRVVTHGRTEGARQEEGTKGIAGQANNPNSTIVNTGCGDLSFGNVKTTGRPGERTPRENIVVAREVINAPINCGTRGRQRR
ncbi:MAG: hypothetical protein KDG89_14635 [Geminicoccaceae bacterium]|nr:hypothetical protein [Geminicoccaceae bacterium]